MRFRTRHNLLVVTVRTPPPFDDWPLAGPDRAREMSKKEETDNIILPYRRKHPVTMEPNITVADCRDFFNPKREILH